MRNSPASSSGDTFPAIFFDQLRTHSSKAVAMREKDYGIWQTYTWSEAGQHVTAFANGLASMGFKRGDRICIVGDNRPELYWGMLAAQCLGGIPVPLYQDSIEREMLFIVSHAEARFALVEDQEQADKLIGIKPECENLEFVIYRDSRGLRNYTEEYLYSIDQLVSMGGEFAEQNPDYVGDEIKKGDTQDLAVICYTSGTTGKPKGVMLSHHNFVETCREFIEFENLHDENALAYLPMAWVGDFFLSFALSIIGGYTVNCPESSSTVMQDLREVGPTFFFAPPRIWENLLTNVMIRMDDAGWIKRKMFDYFIGLASRIQSKRTAGDPISVGERINFAIGQWLVYGPLIDNLGLRKIRLAYTAGESIGPEIFDFFRSLGINLKQLYGMTEASVFVAAQTTGDVRSDTVGPPLPWVSVKITDSGEVLFKSPGAFKGYYKNEEATREAFEGDYVKTGDAGFIDHDGHLKIIDRIKDVTRLTDGTLFAPKYVENKIKFSPFVKEAVAIGQDREYVAMLVNIDAEAVGNWAEKQDMTYTSYTDLAQKTEVYDLIEQEVRRVNIALGEEEELKGVQIRKFLILHKELDPDDEEITRTRKVRRGFIAEKYKDLINALYSELDHIETDAKVTFEDGRSATIRAKIQIRGVAAGH